MCFSEIVKNFLHQCFSSSHVLLIETHVNSKQMSTFSCILCMHCRPRASAVLKIGELSLTICRFNFSRRRFVSLEFCFWSKEKFKINGTKILHVMFVCIISPVEKIFLREFCFAETYFCASRKKNLQKFLASWGLCMTVSRDLVNHNDWSWYETDTRNEWAWWNFEANVEVTDIYILVRNFRKVWFIVFKKF